MQKNTTPACKDFREIRHTKYKSDACRAENEAEGPQGLLPTPNGDDEILLV